MTLVHVTPRARADLRVIGRWTLKEWGEAPMRAYLRAMSERFDWLAQKPQRGRERSDVGPGYRCFPEGRHVVFYVILAEGIAIIGIPHQAMDVEGYFAGGGGL